MSDEQALELRREAIAADLFKHLGTAWGITVQAAKWTILFLEFYGYLDKLKGYTLQDVFDAVAKFQNMVRGLKPDGIPGDKTQHAMRMPRCGCSDAVSMGGALNKWGLDKITYFVRDYVPQLPPSVQDDIHEQAVASWMDVCGIEIEPTRNPSANVIISQGTSRRDSFGVPGGTLAWAYLPQGSNFRGQLLMAFDGAEMWLATESRNRAGTFMLNVSAHEWGHILGKDHGGDGLMQPYYVPSVSAPTPGYDIEEAQKRYGPPQSRPDDTPADLPLRLQLGDVTYSGTVKQT